MKLKVCILQNIFMLLPIITKLIKCIDHMKYIMYYRFNQHGNCLNRLVLRYVLELQAPTVQCIRKWV